MQSRLKNKIIILFLVFVIPSAIPEYAYPEIEETLIFGWGECVHMPPTDLHVASVGQYLYGQSILWGPIAPGRWLFIWALFQLVLMYK